MHPFHRLLPIQRKLILPKPKYPIARIKSQLPAPQMALQRRIHRPQIKPLNLLLPVTNTLQIRILDLVLHARDRRAVRGGILVIGLEGYGEVDAAFAWRVAEGFVLGDGVRVNAITMTFGSVADGVVAVWTRSRTKRAAPGVAYHLVEVARRDASAGVVVAFFF